MAGTLALIALVAPGSARGAAPREVDFAAAAPLSVPAGAVLAYATSRPAPMGADIEALFDGASERFDADGSRVSTTHGVLRVLTPAGAKRLSWYLQPFDGEGGVPTLRARVIAPDGQESALDPRLVSPWRDCTDQRQAAYPLSTSFEGLEVGAVVEVATERSHARPAVPSATGLVRYLESDTPTRRSYYRLDAPAALPLGQRLVGKGVPGALTPRVSRRDGPVVVTVDGTPRPALAGPRLRPLAERAAIVAQVTDASWAAAAAAYGRLVDAALAPRSDAAAGARDLDALAAEIARDATAPDPLVAQIGAWRQRQRWFSSADEIDLMALRPPTESLSGLGTLAQRQQLDEALLFVGLLRARGVEAHVALARGARDVALRRDLPGLGGFDSALVHVPAAREARWFDPAIVGLAPLGALPARLAGRDALVIAPTTRGLVALPNAPRENAADEVCSLTLQIDGPARLEATRETRGIAAEYVRAGPLGQNAECADYPRPTAGAAGDDGTRPVREPLVERATVDPSERGSLKDGTGRVWLGSGGLLGPLRQLTSGRRAVDAPGQRPWEVRTRPHERAEPARATLTWRITLPPGVEVVSETPLPPPLDIGPVSLRAVRSREGQTIVMRYELSIASTELAPAEFERLENLPEPWRREAGVGFELQSTVAKLRRAEDLAGAARTAWALRAAHPEVFATWRWLAEALTALGLRAAAGEVAREAAGRWPERAEAHLLLAEALGDERAVGDDLAEVETALRTSVALAPEDAVAHGRLTKVLVGGFRVGEPPAGAPTRVDEAIAAFAWRDDQRRHRGPARDAIWSPGRDEPVWAWLLLVRGRAAEAERVLLAAREGDREADALRVAAAALARGVEDALVAARAVAQAGRNTSRAVGGAVEGLVALARQDLARALVKRAVAAEPGWGLQPLLERERARDVIARKRPSEGEACRAARAWFQEFVVRRAEPGPAWLPVRYGAYGDRVLDSYSGLEGSGGGEGLSGAAAEAARARAAASWDCTAAAPDGLLTAVELRPERGCGSIPVRVAVLAAGATVRGEGRAGDGTGGASRVYVGTALVLGTEALTALRAGRVEEARAWIGVAGRRGLWGLAWWPALAALGERVGELDLDRLDAERLGVLAAVLAPTGPEREEALRRLEAYGDAGRTPAIAQALRRARVEARLATGRLEEALAELERLGAAGGETDELAAVVAQHVLNEVAAADQRRWLLRVRPLARATLVVDAIDLRLVVTEPDLAGVRARLEARLREPNDDGADRGELGNALAWLALFDGGDLTAALALIPEAGASQGEQHTRAALLAALGRTREAAQALWWSTPEGGEAQNAVVWGRVAANSGLAELARRYYAEAATETCGGRLSVGQLAKAWAAELDARR